MMILKFNVLNLAANLQIKSQKKCRTRLKRVSDSEC